MDLRSEDLNQDFVRVNRVTKNPTLGGIESIGLAIGDRHDRIAAKRATVHRKCEGLSDEVAYQRPIPASALSVASVVAHLRWVESHWFERSFLGRESPQGTATVVGTSTECRWTIS